jgi:hypothetical protein
LAGKYGSWQVTGNTEVISGQKSACRKFRQINALVVSCAIDDEKPTSGQRRRKSVQGIASDLPVIRQQERLSKKETFKLREGGNRFALALEHPFW